MIVAIGNLNREIVFAHHPALNELSATGYHNRLSPSNRSQRGTVRPAPLAGGIGPDERDLCGIGRAAVSRQDVAEPHVLVQGGLADPRQERLGATRNESPVEAANVSPLKQRQERFEPASQRSGEVFRAQDGALAVFEFRDHPLDDLGGSVAVECDQVRSS